MVKKTGSVVRILPVELPRDVRGGWEVREDSLRILNNY